MCLFTPAASLANTSHHHIGGGSNGADDDADCLRWETAADDGGMNDGGTADGGAPAGHLVCVEHATLFGCDCALDAVGARRSGAGGTLALGLLAALAWRARRRRRAG